MEKGGWALINVIAAGRLLTSAAPPGSSTTAAPPPRHAPKVTPTAQDHPESPSQRGLSGECDNASITTPP